MQTEPALTGLPLEVRILGVNGIGHEADNAENCAGRTLPWLQDVSAMSAWALWQITYRDVVILNDQNEIVAIYNLTDNDLGESANYDALLGLLVQAASP